MKGVINILANDATLVALLASGADSVFGLDAPQGESVPHVIVTTIEETPLNNYSDTNCDDLRVQVLSISDAQYTGGSYTGAVEVSEAVRTALVNTTGTHDGDTIAEILLESASTVLATPTRVEREQIYSIMKRL